MRKYCSFWHQLKSYLSMIKYCNFFLSWNYSDITIAGYLVFIIISTSCRNRASQWLFCFTIWSKWKFFSSEKKQSIFGWRGYLSLFKSIAVQSFLFSFMTCYKNCPLLISYEKYQMYSYTTCQIRSLDTPMSSGYGPDLTYWDRCQSRPGSHQQIQEFFSYQNDQSEASKLPYLFNHHWTHPTLFKPSVLSSD